MSSASTRSTRSLKALLGPLLVTAIPFGDHFDTQLEVNTFSTSSTFFTDMIIFENLLFQPPPNKQGAPSSHCHPIDVVTVTVVTVVASCLVLHGQSLSPIIHYRHALCGRDRQIVENYAGGGLILVLTNGACNSLRRLSITVF